MPVHSSFSVMIGHINDISNIASAVTFSAIVSFSQLLKLIDAF